MNYLYLTGSSSGLGKAIAETALAAGNYTVFGFARRNTITHENYIHNTIDLSKGGDVNTIAFEQHPDAEKIILINNAGTEGEIKYLGNLNESVIHRSYHVNIITPHILMNNFIAAYRDVKAEKIIINITSGAASSPYDGWSIYCSTKAAIDMLSQCFAKEQEVQNNGFKIFAIAPGVLDTSMQDRLRTTDKKDFSRIDKFIDLKSNDQLADPYNAAKKILDILRNPAQLSGVVHRLSV